MATPLNNKVLDDALVEALKADWKRIQAWVDANTFLFPKKVIPSKSTTITIGVPSFTQPPATLVKPHVFSGGGPIEKVHSEIAAGEILGWRAWYVKKINKYATWSLKSVARNITWEPGPQVSDLSPTQENTHGFYALKSYQQVLDYFNLISVKELYALGTVEMWGKVIEGKCGYRAEHCEIHSLVCTMSQPPRSGFASLMYDAGKSTWYKEGANKDGWTFDNNGPIITVLRERYTPRRLANANAAMASSSGADVNEGDPEGSSQ
jgi:hypothetical protein